MCETIKLDLIDVFTSMGKIRTEELSYDFTEFDLTHTTYPVVSKSPISLRFEAIEVGKIRLTGNFSVVLEIPCDRCLTPCNETVECEFDQELFSEEELSKLDEAEEVSFLHNTEFDVYDFVNLNVLMNMPSKVLCQDDCKGLCPVCGSNLNETDCGCDSFVPDPRMARIADIFNESKEV